MNFNSLITDNEMALIKKFFSRWTFNYNQKFSHQRINDSLTNQNVTWCHFNLIFYFVNIESNKWHFFEKKFGEINFSEEGESRLNILFAFLGGCVFFLLDFIKTSQCRKFSLCNTRGPTFLFFTSEISSNLILKSSWFGLSNDYYL